jgi:hypothetical protein
VPRIIDVLIQASVYRLVVKNQHLVFRGSCTRDPIVLIIEIPHAVVVLATPMNIAMINGNKYTNKVMREKDGIRSTYANMHPIIIPLVSNPKLRADL